MVIFFASIGTPIDYLASLGNFTQLSVYVKPYLKVVYDFNMKLSAYDVCYHFPYWLTLNRIPKTSD